MHLRHKATQKALQLAICRAKQQAMKELLKRLEVDPWGRLYLTARRNQRSPAPPITEFLEPLLLNSIVDSLFSTTAEHEPPRMAPHDHIDAEDHVIPVSFGELGAAFLRLWAKNTAPGPDGIPGRVWVLTSNKVQERFRLLLGS